MPNAINGHYNPIIHLESTRKNTNKKFIFWLISVLLIGLILLQLWSSKSQWQEVEQAWLSLRRQHPLWICLAIAGAPMGWLVESKKWHYMTRKFTNISFLKAFSSVMTGISFAFISPGKVGDFAGRALYFDATNRWRAVVSVIISNMAHVLVTLLMGFIGAILLVYYGSLWWQWLILGSSLILMIGFGFFYFRIHKINLQRYNKKPWLRKVIIALYLVRKYERRDLMIISFYSLAKFTIYTIQYLLIAYLLGADMPVISSFFIACVMFWMITVIPSFFVADIVLRGNIAHLLFISSGITMSVVPIISASYILWVINWIMPSILGAFILMVFRRTPKE